jgi:hypothetical protein
MPINLKLTQINSYDEPPICWPFSFPDFMSQQRAVRGHAGQDWDRASDGNSSWGPFRNDHR